MMSKAPQYTLPTHPCFPSLTCFTVSPCFIRCCQATSWRHATVIWCTLTLAYDEQGTPVHTPHASLFSQLNVLNCFSLLHSLAPGNLLASRNGDLVYLNLGLMTTAYNNLTHSSLPPTLSITPAIKYSNCFSFAYCSQATFWRHATAIWCTLTLAL